MGSFELVARGPKLPDAILDPPGSSMRGALHFEHCRGRAEADLIGLHQRVETVAKLSMPKYPVGDRRK
eukprot:2134947-Pyramimonas_sp.AAC.1